MLAVKCNNDRDTKIPYRVGTDWISNPVLKIPWNHEDWHPCHGGIYRNVTLTVTEPIYVTLPIYDNMKTVGAYIYDIENSDTKAEVGVEVEVANATSAAQAVVVNIAVKDSEGRVVATGKTNSSKISSNNKTILNSKLSWSDPIRWEPAMPHLYTMEMQVMAGGKQSDLYTTTFGVRTVEFTADRGLFINGRSYKLHGWGHKPTGEWPGLGAALQTWQRDLTLRMMAEAGGNFIRWGHCAGSLSELAMTDKYGIVVLMPGVDGERDCIDEAWETRTAAYREMIVRFRNSPSIFLWECGNYYLSTKHSREMKDIVEQWDPHGTRLFSSRMANNRMINELTYETTTQALDPFFTHLPCVESEYHREESPRRVWDVQSPPNYCYLGGDNPRNEYNLTQEQYIVSAISYWWRMGSKSWHCGGANWIFSDGTHGSRMVVEVARGSGEVDGVRLEKESYWAHKAMWSAEPEVMIVGHWSYPAGTVKDMYAVANTESVELFVNGKSLGKGARTENHLFTWKDVKFESGEISAVGYRDGKAVAETKEITTGEPHSIRLTPITAEGGWLADGADVVLIDVEIVDKDGNRCAVDEAPVHFSLTGNAEWRGGYNSGQEYTILKKTLNTECGINRVALRSTFDAGKATLTVTRDGLPAASITVKSQKVKTIGGLTTDMPSTLSYSPEDAAPYSKYITYDEVESTRAGLEGTKLFRNVSYTGTIKESILASFAVNIAVYCDHVGYRITEYPDVLKGCEMLRLPSIDGRMWARDLLQITPKKDITLYVAHHKTLPLPEWLERFELVEGTVKVSSYGEFNLYSFQMKADDTLTIDGNLPQDSESKSAAQMIFFAKESK